MKKVPMRMCVACREMHPKKTLIRIVSSKDDGVSVDPTGKKSGKGAYICRNTECIEKARKAKALKRAFGREIPGDVYGELVKYAE
jgi:predicted RNA-binding protein YlxR (DUF448 family)